MCPLRDVLEEEAVVRERMRPAQWGWNSLWVGHVPEVWRVRSLRWAALCAVKCVIPLEVSRPGCIVAIAAVQPVHVPEKRV